jgi:hypothetical protein
VVLVRGGGKSHRWGRNLGVLMVDLGVFGGVLGCEAGGIWNLGVFGVLF